MIAICQDNHHTWRSSLTLHKEYEVLRYFNGPITGEPMIEIKCDDDVVREYIAERFVLIEKTN